MKISIITVVRNAAVELQNTLTNLLEVEYDNLEIIVIDGASTDNTPKIIEQYAHSIAYSISEPDLGLYDAMNKGIRAATGDYLWFINAGDYVYSKDILQRIFGKNDEPIQSIENRAELGNSEVQDLNKPLSSENKEAPTKPFTQKALLAQTRKAFQPQSYADIYYGETAVCSAEGKPLGLRRKQLPATLNWLSLKRGMVVCHQSFIVRRSVAPLYDLEYRLVSDIDWVIRSLKNAQSVVNTGLILSQFAEGGISTRNRRASLRERWRVMRKHYGLWATLWAHIRFVFDALFTPNYRKLHT